MIFLSHFIVIYQILSFLLDTSPVQDEEPSDEIKDVSTCTS